MENVIKIEIEKIKQLSIPELVKKQTIDYISYLLHQQKRLAFGLKVDKEANHHLLLGWVGDLLCELTQSLARVFHGVGLIPSDKCVIVTADSLRGENLGETASKTKEKIEECVGGVLVIDGALSTSNSREKTYSEMVNSLLYGMENHSDEMIVVLTSDSIQEYLYHNGVFKSHYKSLGIEEF